MTAALIVMSAGSSVLARVARSAHRPRLSVVGRVIAQNGGSAFLVHVGDVGRVGEDCAARSRLRPRSGELFPETSLDSVTKFGGWVDLLAAALVGNARRAALAREKATAVHRGLFSPGRAVTACWARGG